MIDGIAIIKQLLKESSSCWLTRGALLSYFSTYGGRIEDLDPLIKEKRIIYYETEDLYTLPWIARAENTVCDNLLRLLYKRPAKQFSKQQVFDVIDKLEAGSKYKLHISQREAIYVLANTNVGILTGGPGTGKTTVMDMMEKTIRILIPGTSFANTAPTGKAANRLAESLHDNTCTVHKKFSVQEDGIPNSTRMPEDVLVIDESSMCDLNLMSNILPLLKDGQRIFFVGDIDQLPSVGKGAILRDMIASGVIPVARLTKTFRQNNDSQLFTNIVNIREGRTPSAGDDFSIYQIPPKEVIESDEFKKSHPKVKSFEDTVMDTIRAKYLYGVKKYGIENVCCLIPYRKSGICSNIVSTFLQSFVNKQDKDKTFNFNHLEYSNEEEQKGKITGSYDISFAVGDLVMQLTNREECANGDIGKITALLPDGDGVEAEFYGKTVQYTGSSLNELALAYSMTVNKSQGSEYSYVVMVLLDSHSRMLNRNILYTGITRAKKEVALIAQSDAVKQAVKVKADTDRKTLLKEKLIALSAQYKYVYNIA